MWLFISCSTHDLRPADYVRYVENPSNGLKIKEEVNNVSYSLQYEPINYCVMLEEMSFSIPKEVFETEYNRFKGLEHYVFRIEKSSMDSLVSKMDDTAKYKKGITEYFDFAIQKDIKLVKGSDTIPCSICQRDANTGISQYYTFSLGFYDGNGYASSEQPDRTFVYHNKILHTGNIYLRVKGKDIKHIPDLNM